MTTVKLNWSVSAEEWERFRRYVEQKHGKIKGYIGREAERAMREYSESDEYAGVEDLVDRLVQAAGRSVGGAKTKNNSVAVGGDGEKTRATCRVSKDAKKAFKSHVNQTEMQLGEAFAHACQLRREGGRPDRVKDKLERVVDDAEELLKTQNDDADGGMTKKERNTVAICREIHRRKGTEPGEEIALIGEGEIENAIEEAAGDTDYYMNTYKPRVIDRLDLARDPNKPNLYVPERKVDPTPRFDTEDYGDLTKDERIVGMCVELGRMARKNDGRRQLSVSKIRQYVFDQKPTKDTVKNYMREAGREYEGFAQIKKNGRRLLRCKLQQVSDEELLEYIDHGEPSASQAQMTFEATSQSD